MVEAMTIAIVDDEEDVRESIVQWFQLSGFTTASYASATEALGEITASFAGIVITDIRMPGMDGITFLRRLMALDPSLPVIVITGHGDVSMAVEAMQIGAYDFLEKPFDPERIADLAKRAVQTRRLTLDNRILRRELSDGTLLTRKMLGSSPEISQLREEILDLAQADQHMLIRGETGSGKSLTAHAIHACGMRAGKAFVTLNCAAHAEDTLGTRLFGPDDTTAPALHAAYGGTLVLEDVEEMPPTIQARLMSLLETPEYADTQPPVRIISICNDPGVSLEERLRKDLLYRIGGMQVTVPPLRARGEDVLQIFTHFCEKFADEYGALSPALSAADAALLLQSPWPGNIRQVMSVAERYILHSRREEAALESVMRVEGAAGHGSAAEAAHPIAQKPLKEYVEAFERTLIDKCLRRHHGSIAAVMDELSLPRRTLNEKMAKYGLSRADYVS